MIKEGYSMDLLILIVAFALVTFALWISKRKEKPFGEMRPIPAMRHIEEAIGRAAEMGKSVHFTTGDGSLAGVEALDVAAGVSVLGKVAEYCAKHEVPLRVTCRWPEVFNLSRAVVRAGYERAGRPELFREDMVVFTSQDYFAYNNSVAYYLLREKPAASFLIGYFLGHGIYLGESGARAGALQIGGNHIFFVLCCDYFLLGEELYAAGAYASEDPEMLGSIAAQDMIKTLCLILMVIGVILMFARNDAIVKLLSW
jgi:hypothetical protein